MPLPALNQYLSTMQTADAMAVLQKKYPNASSSLSSDNFVPVWCLADLYQQATFDQLKEGFRYISREVSNDRNATHNLIHNHASVFIASHSVCVRPSPALLTPRAGRDAGLRHNEAQSRHARRRSHG